MRKAVPLTRTDPTLNKSGGTQRWQHLDAQWLSMARLPRHDCFRASVNDCTCVAASIGRGYLAGSSPC
eukprot:5514077-Pyramimonas_sp.AAC.1